MKREERAAIVIGELKKLYPDANCQLKYQEIPHRLVVATILSAQTTDAAVNRATPALWMKYPTTADLALAEISQVEELLKTIGLFRNKTRFIIKAAAFLEKNGLPDTIAELVKIPGVGRKTANVVMGEIFKQPSVTVDTHVKRLSVRLGLSRNTSPEKIERDLRKIIPPDEQTMFCHRMITHGRQVCKARKPLCSACTLQEICPARKKGSP